MTALVTTFELLDLSKSNSKFPYNSKELSRVSEKASEWNSKLKSLQEVADWAALLNRPCRSATITIDIDGSEWKLPVDTTTCGQIAAEILEFAAKRFGEQTEVELSALNSIN